MKYLLTPCKVQCIADIMVYTREPCDNSNDFYFNYFYEQNNETRGAIGI
jgi:hypothetical protein